MKNVVQKCLLPSGWYDVTFDSRDEWTQAKNQKIANKLPVRGQCQRLAMRGNLL
jgi:hypothetical protein